MSDKYASLSPYVYCADNPVKLVDPNGEEVWIPGVDNDGNIIVTQEKDDDFNSFKKFMGPAYSEEDIRNMYENKTEDGVINLTKTYGKEFQIMTDAINDAKKNPDFEKEENYNCWGAALALTQLRKLYGNGIGFLPWSQDGVGINSSGLFDLALSISYTPVDPSSASVGKTIMRFGSYGLGNTTHASIFLGVDNSGRTYTFTKNGWTPRPIVCKTQQFAWKYKFVSGIKFGESGFYNLKQ